MAKKKKEGWKKVPSKTEWKWKNRKTQEKLRVEPLEERRGEESGE